MTKKQRKYYFDVKLKITRALFIINALIWLGFGIYLFREMTSLTRLGFDNKLSAILVAIFMLGNAGAMLASGLLIYKRVKWGFYFGIAVLALNILLTFADQFGFFDFLTLLVDIILLMILVSMTNLYFSKA